MVIFTQGKLRLSNRFKLQDKNFTYLLTHGNKHFSFSSGFGVCFLSIVIRLNEIPQIMIQINSRIILEINYRV